MKDFCEQQEKDFKEHVTDMFGDHNKVLDVVVEGSENPLIVDGIVNRLDTLVAAKKHLENSGFADDLNKDSLSHAEPIKDSYAENITGLADVLSEKNSASKALVDGHLTINGKEIYIPGDRLNSGIGADFDMDTGSPRALLLSGLTDLHIYLISTPTPSHKSMKCSKLSNEVDCEMTFKVIKSRSPLTKSQKKKMSPRRIKKESKKVLPFVFRGKHY